ncbi:MAG TPA: TIGR04211 family SH3 domain-containing protein [Steroidobacteraceae bacterium]
MSSRARWWLLALPLAPVCAHADPVYVVDQLIVNVVNGPEAQATRVATVRSGERLELLGRASEQAHVRLANGTEGWIKAAYLTAEPPAQQRLAQKTAEVDTLRQDVGRLQSELAAARAAAVATVAPAAADASRVHDPVATANPRPVADAGLEPGSSAEALQPAQASDATLFAGGAASHGPALWEWVTGASAVMFALGYVLGWRMLDRRIRQKFGGLRIY